MFNLWAEMGDKKERNYYFINLLQFEELNCESEVKVTQSCPTLCDPVDYTVHGILQAIILEPFPSPGDLPNTGMEPRSPTLQVGSLPAEPHGKPKYT